MFAIVANFAMSCEFGKVIANLAMGCEFGNVVCEFGKVVCEVGKVVCEFGNVVCEVGNGVAKLAMRNFAKVLKFYVRQMNSVLWLANFAMPTEIAN